MRITEFEILESEIIQFGIQDLECIPFLSHFLYKIHPNEVFI